MITNKSNREIAENVFRMDFIMNNGQERFRLNIFVLLKWDKIAHFDEIKTFTASSEISIFSDSHY